MRVCGCPRTCGDDDDEEEDEEEDEDDDARLWEGVRGDKKS